MEAPARRRRRPSRRQAGAAALALLLLLALGGALAAFRYLPALDEARALRADLEATVDRVQTAGLGIDAPAVAVLEADLAAARARLDNLEGLVSGDPLIALARVLPPTADTVRGADRILEAGDRVIDAIDDGLVVARRFVAIREAQATDPGGGATLGQLVELMVATRPDAVLAAAAVADAREALAAVPTDVPAQIDGIRAAMAERLDRYEPVLQAYLDASQRLPAIMGWEGLRRYLVLTQDPAELRPSGGLIGSYGIITFEHGRLVEQSFHGVSALDYPWDYPPIAPPRELTDYLVDPGTPWQLADAGWSPDFPTSAQAAMRLYVNESGDADIDGVVAITTHTIDELLALTGPVTVPEYGVTVAPGETTLTLLQHTRAATEGEDRKALLPAFADGLFEALFAMPPERWGEIPDVAATLYRSHMLLAWFGNPADQSLAARFGFDGAVRQDAGDYLYPVDANVRPSSKLDAWTARTLALEVELDAEGGARHTLVATLDNRVDEPEGAAYRAMENVGGRTLGVFARLLVPEQSRPGEVTGTGQGTSSSAPVVGEEAGRRSMGTYLQVPPGVATLDWRWTSPQVADVDETGGSYRLTIQRQPGAIPGPITVRIRVPDGLRITEAPDGVVVIGREAMLTTLFDRDLVLTLRYAP